MSHVRDRAMERFGLILSGSDIVGLLRQIETGSAAVLGHQGGNRTLYQVVLPDGQMAIAVQTKDGQILTLLPPTWSTPTGHREAERGHERSDGRKYNKRQRGGRARKRYPW